VVRVGTLHHSFFSNKTYGTSDAYTCTLKDELLARTAIVLCDTHLAERTCIMGVVMEQSTTYTHSLETIVT
jgi:hypothetical protein